MPRSVARANPFTSSSVAVVFCQVSRERSNLLGSSARRGERFSRCWQPSGSRPVSLIGNKRSTPSRPFRFPFCPDLPQFYIARKPAGLPGKLNPSCRVQLRFARVLAALGAIFSLLFFENLISLQPREPISHTVVSPFLVPRYPSR